MRIYPMGFADTYYEAGCNGLCGGSKTGQLILEALVGTDGAVDFGQYDNDGPDEICSIQRPSAVEDRKRGRYAVDFDLSI